MAYQPTTNFGWAMPRGGDQAQISVINQQFTAKADEIVYQTRRMIAPGYIDDGSKTYQPGEIVEYENVDYVCTGTTSGAWDSSKWDSTDMATQIQEAKESGGGASTLAYLDDVEITSPTEGQILTYDDVNDEWVNTDKPTLGTASSKDVAASGNASSTQVVMGNDTRLTDRRGSTWGQINGTLANQTDLKGALDDIGTRIDGIIALPDGSTTADAELVDIRTGVHGATYSSAGDAVRANANQLYNMKTGFDGVTYASPAAMVQGEDRKIADGLTNLINYVGVSNVKAYFDSAHLATTSVMLQSGVTYSITNKSSISANYMVMNDSTYKIASPNSTFELTPTRSGALVAYKNTATTNDYIDITINSDFLKNDKNFEMLNTAFFELFNKTGMLGMKQYYDSEHGCITPIVLTRGITYYFTNRSNITSNYFMLDAPSQSITVAANTNFEFTPTVTGYFAAYKNTATTSDYVDIDVSIGLVKKVKEIEEQIESGTTGEVYYVDPRGSGDYTTFSAALEDLKDNNNQKTIFVLGGTYDIFEEMGGATYIASIDPTTQEWNEVNNIVPPNTKIIGRGEVILDYNPTDAEIIDHAHGWLMSPLNIIGSCEIENVTINCSNCRYAIHIESAGDGEKGNNAVVTLRNVRAHRGYTTLLGTHQTVGCGIGFNGKWTFDNCKFTGNNVNNYIFSVHTNVPRGNCSASLTFNDCVIDSTEKNTGSKNIVGFLSAYLPEETTNFAFLNNCYIGGKVATETSITFRQSYDVSIVGGSIYGVTDSPDATSGYTINNYGANIIGS